MNPHKALSLDDLAKLHEGGWRFIKLPFKLSDHGWQGVVVEDMNGQKALVDSGLNANIRMHDCPIMIIPPDKWKEYVKAFQDWITKVSAPKSEVHQGPPPAIPGLNSIHPSYDTHGNYHGGGGGYGGGGPGGTGIH